jgi:hypothetical protein
MSSRATGSKSALAYVIAANRCVGFVLARGRSGHEGLDRNENSLGFFRTEAAAANAVLDAANEERAR